MMKIILIFTFMIVFHNACELKLAKSLPDLYHGNEIYDSGNVNPLWQENSYEHYISDYYNTIEYFYLMEMKHDVHEDNVALKIKSDKAESFVNPKAEIKDKLPEIQLTDKLSNSFMLKSFEVTYNCAKESHGEAKISLTIETSDCPVFTIHWKKLCKPMSKYSFIFSWST